MRSTVRITFGHDEVLVHLPAGESPWAADEARRWLDDQFVARECEPLRASGKVLTKDKILAVAAAIGRRGFEDDEVLRRQFARAATSALEREVVSIDVDARTVAP